MNKIKTIGTREEVFNGLAKTSGGLQRKDIIKKKINILV